jgi:hypothetical protein
MCIFFRFEPVSRRKIWSGKEWVRPDELTESRDYAITKMPGEITKGLGISTTIAIPTVPTTFFPGLKPSSSLLGG